ncbi:MAG: response regulator [Bryobacteraceae bacterium]|jgi:CheY-like chemotaxis protein
MGGEAILVVDDAEVNRTLTDIVLTDEGFDIHTVAGGEEALSLLRSFHPDLMLVDIRMPGMDGLELTRRVKQNERTRDVVVVALTACAAEGDEQKATATGCDGYITKPIDTHMLGTQVRQYLALRTSVPRAEPTPVGGTPTSDRDVEALRRRFLEEGILQSRQMLECLNQQFDVAKASGLLHRWVGAAGILGYTNISEWAHQGVELLCAPVRDRERLRAVLTDLEFAFSELLEAGHHPLPESIVNVLSGKRIALVGFTTEVVETLCAALERAGALPRLFAAEELPNSALVRQCHAVLYHVRRETMHTPWIAPDASTSPEQPLVLVGGREHIMRVNSTVQARVREFLIDGWQPEEALMRLGFALSRADTCTPTISSAEGSSDTHRETNSLPDCGPPEILIADDDPLVRTLVGTTLQNHGMRCRLAATGPEALQIVHECRPRAAVLDVVMPGMSGYQVLAAIREEDLPVRVILLTACERENDISRGFSLGADDYIVKPFNVIELVARLRRLLRRPPGT